MEQEEEMEEEEDEWQVTMEACGVDIDTSTAANFFIHTLDEKSVNRRAGCVKVAMDDDFVRYPRAIFIVDDMDYLFLREKWEKRRPAEDGYVHLSLEYDAESRRVVEKEATPTPTRVSVLTRKCVRCTRELSIDAFTKKTKKKRKKDGVCVTYTSTNSTVCNKCRVRDTRLRKKAVAADKADDDDDDDKQDA